MRLPSWSITDDFHLTKSPDIICLRASLQGEGRRPGCECLRSAWPTALEP